MTVAASKGLTQTPDDSSINQSINQ